MKRNNRKKIRQLPDKIASIVSIVFLILAWYLGGIRIASNETGMLSYLAEEGAVLESVSPDLYRTRSEHHPDSEHWVSRGTGIGYGGEINVAVAVDDNGIVRQMAILSSRETSSYLEKVIEARVPQQILGQNIRRAMKLDAANVDGISSATLVPNSLEVDGVSSATLTTNAIQQGINQAADLVRYETLGYRLGQSDSPLANFGWIDIAAFLIFAAAVWISRTRHSRKKALNWALMLSSMALLGFYSASLFSSTTMGIFISGSWIAGLGNYTAFILMTLTVVYLLTANKNVYCESICPFGTTQQCLSKITNSKPVTLKHNLFTWIPRATLLVTLGLGLYFRNPAGFSYEPFGIMFGMTGSMYLFILTFTIILTSLIVYRPWCKTFCPAVPVVDFIKFNKTWVKQIQKDRKRAAGKKKPRKPRQSKGEAITVRSIS